MRLKPRHVEKFRECRLTDVGEGELTEKRKMRKMGKKGRNGVLSDSSGYRGIALSSVFGKALDSGFNNMKSIC